MSNESDETKWTIGYQDEAHKKEITDKATSTAELSKRWDDFERDVTINPYYHSKRGRIEKLKDTSFKGNFVFDHRVKKLVF